MSRSNPQPDIRQVISDRNWRMPWGKYRGETIQDLLDNVPDYLCWVADNVPDIDFAWDILEEARQGPRHTFTGFSSRNDPRG